MAKMLTIGEALREGFAEEMEKDERVFIMGTDVGAFGGFFGEFAGLQAQFGERRVFDTPISEMFIAGGAVGAAITGLRPVVQLNFADFVVNAMDELYGKAAQWRYMHGGLFTVPMVVLGWEGAVGGAGPEHSQCPEGLFWSAPGMYVAIPSTPADAKGMIKAAIRDDNPVLFLLHKGLTNAKGEVPDGDHLVPLGKADIKRAGTDVTVIAWSNMVPRSLEAAEIMAREGVSVEVVDPRGIRPLDTETILKSVAKTGRVVIAHEARRSGGPGGEVAAIIAEKALDSLEAPIKRVTAPDVPIPQSMFLEPIYVPQTANIVAAIKEVAGS